MTLPGMPLAAGDPGVFICGPRDVAPWETEAPRPRVTRSRDGAGAPNWLVLTGCIDCNPRTGRYCRDHDVNNWWLTNWGTGQKQKTRPAQPLDAGT